MARLEATCPPCGSVMTADTEGELIRIVKEHARREHQHEVSDDDARASIVRREASDG